MDNGRVIDYVIFDFHGTLTDHNKRLFESLRRACEDTQLDPSMIQAVVEGLSEQSAQQVPQKEYLKRFVPAHIFDEFWDKFKWYRDVLYLPVDGLKETVQELRRQGIGILFLTNGTVVDNLYARHIGEDESYANIIWKILVEEWQVYSGEGDDVPFVMSIDDFDFISRKTKKIPAEFFNRAAKRHVTDEDYIVHQRGDNQVIKKPHPLLYDAVGRIMTLVQEQDFDPERCLFVTDYRDDAFFGVHNRMPTMMFVKGMRQYYEVLGDSGRVNLEHMHPYFHMAEIPYFCQYGDSIERTGVFTDNNLEVVATVEGTPIYRMDARIDLLQSPQFEELDERRGSIETE